MVKDGKVYVMFVVCLVLIMMMNGCDLKSKAKIEENIALADLWILEIWNKGRDSAIDELCADNFTFNYPVPGASSDKEGYKKTLRAYKNAFQGLTCDVIEMIADADKVVVRWKCTSSHKGPFLGIAPTGKELTTTGISILTFEGTKIVEEYAEMDMMGMFQQLGMFPIQGQQTSTEETVETEEAEEE